MGFMGSWFGEWVVEEGFIFLGGSCGKDFSVYWEGEVCRVEGSWEILVVLF